MSQFNLEHGDFNCSHCIVLFVHCIIWMGYISESVAIVPFYLFYYVVIYQYMYSMKATCILYTEFLWLSFLHDSEVVCFQSDCMAKGDFIRNGSLEMVTCKQYTFKYMRHGMVFYWVVLRHFKTFQVFPWQYFLVAEGVTPMCSASSVRYICTGTLLWYQLGHTILATGQAYVALIYYLFAEHYRQGPETVIESSHIYWRFSPVVKQVSFNKKWLDKALFGFRVLAIAFLSKLRHLSRDSAVICHMSGKNSSIKEADVINSLGVFLH